MTTINTNLAIGATQRHYFSETQFVEKYNNIPFTCEYNDVESFLKDFTPTIPSEKLMNRIREEFAKQSGQITFKPVGYKANQIFHFSN